MLLECWSTGLLEADLGQDCDPSSQTVAGLPHNSLGRSLTTVTLWLDKRHLFWSLDVLLTLNYFIKHAVFRPWLHSRRILNATPTTAGSSSRPSLKKRRGIFRCELLFASLTELVGTMSEKHRRFNTYCLFKKHEASSNFPRSQGRVLVVSRSCVAVTRCYFAEKQPLRVTFIYETVKYFTVLVQYCVSISVLTRKPVAVNPMKL